MGRPSEARSSTPRFTRLRGPLPRALPFGILLLALVGAPVMIFSSDGMPRLETVQGELDAVQRDNTVLRREIVRLRARVRELRDDPAAVERLARDELGLIRQSEVVFQFPAGR